MEESDGSMSLMKRLMEEYPLNHMPRKAWEGKLHPYKPIRTMDDYVVIGNERYYPDQLRVFREAWQMLVDECGRIPEMTEEQEAVARYLKLYPPSKVIGVEIDGKKYRGTVYLVEEHKR